MSSFALLSLLVGGCTPAGTGGTTADARAVDARPADAAAIDAATIDAAADASIDAMLVDGPFDAWLAASPLPFARYGHEAAATDRWVYVLGGDRAGNVQLRDVLVAPILPGGALGAWSPTTPLPGADVSLESAIVNDHVYAIGGAREADGQLADVWVAPIEATGMLGAWRSTARLPEARATFAAVAHEGCIYVIGGNHGEVGINLSDVYAARPHADGSIDAWVPQPSLPEPLTGHAAVVTRHGGADHLYVISGTVTSPARPTVLEARIQAGTCTISGWSALASSIPSGRIYHDVIALGGAVYVLGGYSYGLGNLPLADVLVAPLDLGDWQPSTPLPSGRYDAAGVVAGGRICMIGGASAAGILDEVVCQGYGPPGVP